MLNILEIARVFSRFLLCIVQFGAGAALSVIGLALSLTNIPNTKVHAIWRLTAAWACIMAGMFLAEYAIISLALLFT